MNASILSSWGIGVLNGYTKEPLPWSYKYTTMSIATTLLYVKALGNISPKEIPMKSGSIVASIFVGVPLVVGSTFCMGTFIGKAAKKSFGDDRNIEETF